MSVKGLRWGALIAMTLVFVLAAALVAGALPRYETSAYYSVVKDKPYAGYTDAEVLQRTSTIPYYSVVKDKPYAGFTDADLLKRTSTIAYYSVLH